MFLLCFDSLFVFSISQVPLYGNLVPGELLELFVFFRIGEFFILEFVSVAAEKPLFVPPALFFGLVVVFFASFWKRVESIFCLRR